MKRNPNGYGLVRKLSGNRLKPWAVYTPKKLQPDGTKKRECIGYFETSSEANTALATWNRTRGTKTNFTLEQLYDEWSAKAYTTLDKDTVNCYSAAWKHLEPLHKVKVRELRSGHFQEIIDATATSRSWSTLHNIKILAGLLEKYAMSYDVIEKNYAEFVKLPEKVEKEREIFSDEQLRILEEAAEKNFMQSRLIMILLYMGWRITEFVQLTPEDFDPVNMTFKGGIKTENGKNRVVPIPEPVQGYVLDLLNQKGPALVCREQPHGKRKDRWIELVPVTSGYFRKNWFKPTLDALGIVKEDGTSFTPHVCRHNYASRLRKNGADPLVIKKLMGHSPKADVTEKVYTHVDLDQLMTAAALISKNKPEKKTE